MDRLYSELLRGGLAPSSVRRVHAVLHAALEEAVRGDLIPRNPATYANKSTAKQEEIEPLDASQAAAFLQAARGNRFEALYVLCLMCGFRSGRGARVPLERYRPRRRDPPGEPSATARQGREQTRLLRAQEREPLDRGIPPAGRKRPREPPQATA